MLIRVRMRLPGSAALLTDPPTGIIIKIGYIPEKAEPFARRERKATGLEKKTTGLPKEHEVQARLFVFEEVPGEAIARRKEGAMLARQIMQKDLVTILPASTVFDAAVKMKKYNVGSVLVVEEGWKLKGILTDRDIVLTIAADSKDPKETCVSDIMIPDPITITSDADVDSALRVMNRAHVHRLPVTENGKLVGLLSSADLAAEMKEEFNQFIGLEETFAKHTH